MRGLQAVAESAARASEREREAALVEARRRADASGEVYVVFSSDEVSVPVRTTFGAWAIAPVRTAGSVEGTAVYPSSGPAPGYVQPDTFWRLDNWQLWAAGAGVLGVLGTAGYLLFKGRR